MIKVKKDLVNIPDSLLDRKTSKRRDNCVRDKKYHQKKEFHQRYKQKDTKESLKKIYNKKCAFCEQEIRECSNNELEDCSSTVEHYRPKSIYYWLAYSWDNLLWCCHRCNQNKGNSFDTDNNRVVYDTEFEDAIHTSATIYSLIEKPFMINPELESVLKKLSFEDGIMASTDSRVRYTIDVCKLNRYDLTEKRLRILEDFVMKARKKNRLNKSYSDILDGLKRDFMNEKSEFRALKYWILINHKVLVDEK